MFPNRSLVASVAFLVFAASAAYGQTEKATTLDKLKAGDIPAAEKFPWQPKELVAVYGSHAWHFWTRHDYTYAVPVHVTTDGKAVTILGSNLPWAGYPGDAVRVTDAATGKDRAAFTFPKASGVGFSARGTLVALTQEREFDWVGTVWDTATKKKKFALSGKGAGPSSLYFSPTAKYVAAYGKQITPFVYDLPTGKPLFALPNYVSPPAFHPTQPLAYYTRYFQPEDGGTGDAFLYEMNLATGKQRTLYEQKTAMFGGIHSSGPVRVSPDGGSLIFPHTALANNNQVSEIVFWNLRKGAVELKVSPKEGFADYAFTPDSRSLAVALHDGRVRFYERGTGKETATIGPTERDHALTRLAFSPDGKAFAATAAPAAAVQLWDVAGNRPLHAPTEATRVLAVAADGATLLVATSVTLLQVYPTGLQLVDVATGKRRPIALPKGWSSVAQAAFYDQGRSVLLLGHGQIACYAVDTAAEQPGHPLTGATDGTATRFILTPDGRTMFIGAAERPRCAFWDTRTGKVRGNLVGAGNGVAGLAVSPDSKTMYASTEQGVEIIDVETAKVKKILPSETAGRIALSADGTKLAIATETAQLLVWNAADGKELYTLTGHTAGITDFCFDASGNSIFTCGNDGRLFRWFSADAKTEWRLPGAVGSFVRSADGRHLILNNGNGTAYVLRVEELPE